MGSNVYEFGDELNRPRTWNCKNYKMKKKVKEKKKRIGSNQEIHDFSFSLSSLKGSKSNEWIGKNSKHSRRWPRNVSLNIVSFLICHSFIMKMKCL